MITWTYDDGNGNTTPQTQVVIIEDTIPPVPDEDELPVVEGQCSATITTIPTATDNCDGTVIGATTDPLTYTEQGTHIVTWTFEDENGNTTTQTQSVIVQDTEPPVIEDISVDPCILWPPNHKMRPVSVSVTATDNCDESPVSTIVSVTSSQPLNGKGDGNTDTDWEITGDLTVDLRAERSRKIKSNREYTITVECTDAAGNSSTGTVKVIVPKNKRTMKRLTMIK